MTTTLAPPNFAPGSLVRARNREWVVQPGGDEHVIILRPLGGGEDDEAAILHQFESVQSASFAPPTVADLGDALSAAQLRTALRIGFRSTAGPFRSLARLSVEPRAYQFVPLMLALKQEVTRLLIADDVGIGKTIEAGLIASELLALGEVQRLAVLCSPALAEQWQQELRDKFGLEAELVIPSTATRLQRNLLHNESLFDKHPYVVVSTDFIKSHTRMQDFVNHCPELVIVDEAHTVVADGQQSTAAGTKRAAVRGSTQRYELVSRLAADPTRHLVLVTATPHSGKEEGFRNLVGLLDPKLATIDLEQTAGRELLAKHMVQRRRGDIRRFIDDDSQFSEDTKFPSDRAISDSAYNLSKEYESVFTKVLEYAREQVTDPTSGDVAVRQRVRWWSALGLLRALSSSPAAAAETLRTRARSLAATTAEEADDLGRSAVLDLGDDETVEGFDVVPGADDDPSESNDSTHRKRLLALARECEALAGPKTDRKLEVLTKKVKELLADGYEPIVFCRFIATADYVQQHLSAALKKSATVIAVTGKLPPEERAKRVADLASVDGPHVLIATDCLSEGVNLQDHFQAVVHYDLAWNPTRHEQREGRVDRFGQPRDIVRALTIYGQDNGIDGIVLDILIRKHREISRATGVSVPVPDQSDSVVQALMEGLILRGHQKANQLTLDLGMDTVRAELHSQWESAAERHKLSKTKYAHAGIRPQEVAREVAEARAALGTKDDVERFVVESVRALGGTVTIAPNVLPNTNATSAAPGVAALTAVTSTLPIGLRDALPPGHAEPLPFHRDLPAPRRQAVLSRTDSAVEAIARHVLDAALDPLGKGRRAAARAGVIRTNEVEKRTTLLMVRFRFHLDLPTPTGLRQLVTEDARFVAFEGSPSAPTWLDGPEVEQLQHALPSGNIAADQAAQWLTPVIDALPTLNEHLEGIASSLGETLLDAHRRVRAGANAARRGLNVSPQLPVDLLGVYVLLPSPTTGSGA